MKGIKDFERFKETPFHDGTKESLHIKMFNVGKTKEGRLVNTDTGELIEKYAWADIEKPVKMYSGIVDKVMDLSTPGMKMFLYILANLGVNEEKVYISNSSAMLFCGYSRPKDVYKGMIELLDRGMLAKTKEQYLYWVNPEYMFKGNKSKLLR